MLEQLRQMLLTGYLQDVLDIADTQRIHHRLQPRDIRYIESRSHTIFIYTIYGCIQTREYSLSAMAEQLEPPLSAATGVIWSIRSISQALTDLQCYLLADKDTIPVSQSGIALLKDYI